MSELAAQLTELGMTRNEALGWLALLAGPEEGCTGYEVAARSGIPRSAVYTVLRKLEERGATFAVGDRPTRYVPTSPEQLLSTLRESHRQRLQSLEESLAGIEKRDWPEPIWIVRDYAQVLSRIEQMARSAERSLYCSLWPREVKRLRPALEAATEHAEVVLYSPDGVRPLAGVDCWSDAIDDDAKADWSHRALVVVDRRQALIGGTEPLADNQAVVTTNISLVNVAADHIIMDITRLAAKQGRDPKPTVGRMMRPHMRGA